MFLDDADFPKAILKILLKEAGNAGARRVPGKDRRILPNLSTRTNDAQVQLVVLVTHQSFVEQAQAEQRFFAPTAVGDGIDGPFVVFLMKARAAGGEAGVVGGGNRARNHAVHFGARRPAHVVRSGLHQSFHTTETISGRVKRMGIHAQNDFALRFPNRRVQTGGNNAAGIVNDAKAGMRLAVFFKQLARTVVAHAVGDNHFPIHTVHLLSGDGLEERRHMADFVAARADDGDVHAWLLTLLVFTMGSGLVNPTRVGSLP